MQVWTRIFRCSKELCICHIKIWLQLYYNNIRKFIGRTACCALIQLSVFIDFCHFFLCVPVWLTDSGIEQTRRKTIWKTVIFIGKCNISKIRRYYSFIYCRIRDKCVKYAAHNNSQQRCYVVYLSCILSAASPHWDQPDHKRSCSDSDHNDFKAITIVIDQRDSVSCDLKILCIKRCNPL